MSSLVIAATVLQLMVSPSASVADLSLVDLATSIREVWAPIVEVVVSGPGSLARIGAQVIELRFSDAAPVTPTGEPSGALAWIEFVDGVPQPVITVSPRRAADVLHPAVVLGRPSRDWPDHLRRRVLATAMARAIAHEIGHYLLRSREHSTSGLMRARFRAQDFTDPEAGRFRLSSVDRERVLAQLAAPMRAARTW